MKRLKPGGSGARRPRIIIAGVRGGSGKTIVSLGLLAALKKRGFTIVPYKKGPDYIDAGWLSAAAGRPCYNLDAFLIGKDTVCSSFESHSRNADGAVIEGNRGLYDGMDAQGTYSTAELAKLLKAPVLLVMDCTKATRTVSAMVRGMQVFDRKVEIRGVVLNQVAGERHEKVLRESIGRYCGIPVVGVIPRLATPPLSERHMGLLPFQEHGSVESSIADMGDIAEQYLSVDRIWGLAQDARRLDRSGSGKARGAGATGRPSPASTVFAGSGEASSPLIGVVRDSAFQFYYEENLEELGRRGARILEINALREKALPPVDALYIGGGFPETHAIALAKNVTFRRSLRKAVDDGLPVYAECGGLMYLGDAILVQGKRYPMTGVFPVTFSLEARPQAHGYTVVSVRTGSRFFPKGTVLRGHEFHYSRIASVRRGQTLRLVFRMRRGKGITDGLDGLVHGNVLATYTHLHALGSPAWADGLIRQAELHRRRRERHG